MFKIDRFTSYKMWGHYWWNLCLEDGELLLDMQLSSFLGTFTDLADQPFKRLSQELPMQISILTVSSHVEPQNCIDSDSFYACTLLFVLGFTEAWDKWHYTMQTQSTSEHGWKLNLSMLIQICKKLQTSERIIVLDISVISCGRMAYFIYPERKWAFYGNYLFSG